MKKSAIILFILITSISCTNKDEVLEITTSNIKINLNQNEIITKNDYSIQIDDNFNIEELNIFIDNNLIKKLNASPYKFSIKRADYSDGNHSLRVEVKTTTQESINKSINFKIDNTGPKLTEPGIINNQQICDKIIFEPKINDQISSVKKVKIFIESTFISEFTGSSDFSFSINPNNFSGGVKKLKFEMEDNIGNISEEYIDINIGKPLLNIDFPNQFIRKNIEKFHVIISDKKGNYLDHKTYSDTAEVIEFCSSTILDNNTEFMLTFFEVFNNSIYNAFNYSNLTKENIGNKITFKERTLNLTHKLINLSLSGIDLSTNVRASGYGYSMVNINNFLNGHTTTSFNNNLGSIKTLIHSYDSQTTLDTYKWAFINNIQNRTELKQSDFTQDNVKSGNVTFSKNVDTHFLKIYGFENNQLYNLFNGHSLYSSPMSKPKNSQVFKYQYADIFNHYFYSLQSDNYYIQGLGIPKSENFVPRTSVSFGWHKQLGELTFRGLNDFEVGRLRLRKSPQSGLNISKENPSIIIEFIFDGQKEKIFIPKVPEGIFEGSIHKIFNNYDFEVIQGIAENYSGYSNYKDYLQNVFISSSPFYLSSEFRERIFASNISLQLLPVWEFPYYSRF